MSIKGEESLRTSGSTNQRGLACDMQWMCRQRRVMLLAHCSLIDHVHSPACDVVAASRARARAKRDVSEARRS